MSRVALAPSAGRAEGALLTVILHGSTMDRREDGSLYAARGCAGLCDLQLRGRAGGLEHADAAVARRA